MLTLLFACASPDSAVDAGVSYADDVRPILDRNCARCHTTGGQATSFDDGQAVAALAPAILAYLDAEHMPPAAPDPSCREYEDSDRYWLDDTERATLQTWLDEGTIVDSDPGVGADAPDVLPSHDVELFGGTPYTPDFDGTGNDYRCFALPVGNEDTVYMTSAEALVDNLQIVHHVVIFSVGQSTSLDESPEGFECDGLGAQGWDLMAAWAPGANPLIFPEGSGMKIKGGARLVLQMHYYDSFDGASEATDQSGYGMTLVDSVEREVEVLGAGSTSFTIPADDPAYAVAETYPWSRGAIEVFGVWPHMHVLGSGIDERLTRADGTEECLLHQDRWDFHNQVYAQFTESVIVDQGDSLTVSCTYDNSTNNPLQVNSPPRDVSFGEGTGDEMCFAFTYAMDVE